MSTALSDRALAFLGFGAAEYLGLSPTQQARAFDVRITRNDELAAVKGRLMKNLTDDQRARANHLRVMSAGLKVLYCTKENMAKWMNAPNKLLADKVPKDLILSGHLSDVERVASLVQRLLNP